MNLFSLHGQSLAYPIKIQKNELVKKLIMSNGRYRGQINKTLTGVISI